MLSIISAVFFRENKLWFIYLALICLYTFFLLFLFSRKQLILDRISKGINDKVNAGSPFKKALFKFAYKYKADWLQRGYTTPILDK